MLLFQKRFHAGLVDGSISLTFRRWQKPHVRVGGRYRVHPIGVVEVTEVSQVRLGALTLVELKSGGFVSRDDLTQYLTAPVKTPQGVVVREPVDDETALFRVALRHGGQDDRVELALVTELSADEVAAIQKKLDRLDANAPKKWVEQTFELIRTQPQVAASKLAKQVKRETLPFKVDVRKLKKLGLTMSFEVGYEISPRGKAFFAARKKLAGAKTKKKKKKAPARRAR